MDGAAAPAHRHAAAAFTCVDAFYSETPGGVIFPTFVYPLFI
jgi:hypothetical protein